MFNQNFSVLQKHHAEIEYILICVEHYSNKINIAQLLVPDRNYKPQKKKTFQTLTNQKQKTAKNKTFHIKISAQCPKNTPTTTKRYKSLWLKVIATINQK